MIYDACLLKLLPLFKVRPLGNDMCYCDLYRVRATRLRKQFKNNVDERLATYSFYNSSKCRQPVDPLLQLHVAVVCTQLLPCTLDCEEFHYIVVIPFLQIMYFIDDVCSLFYSKDLLNTLKKRTCSENIFFPSLLYRTEYKFANWPYRTLTNILLYSLINVS